MLFISKILNAGCSTQRVLGRMNGSRFGILKYDCKWGAFPQVSHLSACSAAAASKSPRGPRGFLPGALVLGSALSVLMKQCPEVALLLACPDLSVLCELPLLASCKGS